MEETEAIVGPEAGSAALGGKYKILLFWPNIVGYVRIVLLAVAFAVYVRSDPQVFLILYVVQAALDWLDGVLARKLKQVSSFGAWFDVIIDNFGRTLIWANVHPSLGGFVGAFEWCVFVALHTRGAGWKTDFENAPLYVKRVFANGFKNLIGFFVIGGLHCLPMWLYFIQQDKGAIPRILVFLVLGRSYSAAVELWVLWKHVYHLLHDPKE